jgi:hypothetical protein
MQRGLVKAAHVEILAIGKQVHYNWTLADVH